jgi:hypothetical protein
VGSTTAEVTSPGASAHSALNYLAASAAHLHECELPPSASLALHTRLTTLPYCVQQVTAFLLRLQRCSFSFPMTMVFLMTTKQARRCTGQHEHPQHHYHFGHATMMLSNLVQPNMMKAKTRTSKDTTHCPIVGLLCVSLGRVMVARVLLYILHAVIVKGISSPMPEDDVKVSVVLWVFWIVLAAA